MGEAEADAVNQSPTPNTQNTYTREEVSRHNTKDDCWIIIYGKVYNVTSWLDRHPGGAQLLLNHAGEDATVAWQAFHRNNKTLVSKYLRTYLIGSLVDEDKEYPSQIDKDFLEFSKELENKGYFKARPVFFAVVFLHAVVLELSAGWILWYFGNTWSTWIISGIVFALSGIQFGSQGHDLLHGSVFNSTKLNHFFHDFVLGFLQGAPINWWDGRHYLHHTKPNVVDKDPDITIPFNFFLLGKVIPREWGEKHWGIFPYTLQHIYFTLTAPSFGMSVFFPLEFIVGSLRHGMWKNLFWASTFYIRFYLMYSWLLGGFLRSLGWFMFVRFAESQMYVWATQINHLTMEIDRDKKRDWVTMQCAGTCDVDPSLFMDWFTAHLNYQLEHHLFPSMPRSSYSAVKPMVREFCEKHGIVYESKTFFQGIVEIIRSLKQSGTIWAEAWKEPHSKVH